MITNVLGMLNPCFTSDTGSHTEMCQVLVEHDDGVPKCRLAKSKEHQLKVTVVTVLRTHVDNGARTQSKDHQCSLKQSVGERMPGQEDERKNGSTSSSTKQPPPPSPPVQVCWLHQKLLSSVFSGLLQSQQQKRSHFFRI